MVLLALGAVGVGTLVRSGGPPLMLALLVGAFLLVLSSFQSLYYVEGRHRWGVEAMIVAFSGGGVAALLSRRLERRLREAPLAVTGRWR